MINKAKINLYTTNILKLFLFRNPRRKWIEIIPEIKDAINPRIKGIGEALQVPCKIFLNSTKPAPKISGADNKKENRAAWSRLRFKKSPSPIVAPERETPGIMARACARPINIVSFIFKSCIVLFFFPSLSAKQIIIPNNPRAPAIRRGFLNMDSALSSKIMPKIAAGMVAMIINHISFLSIGPLKLLSRRLQNPSFNNLDQSFRKYTNIANRLPQCNITSKLKVCLGQPNNQGIIIKCPELLIGKNSVIPWIKPKITDCKIAILFYLYALCLSLGID